MTDQGIPPSANRFAGRARFPASMIDELRQRAKLLHSSRVTL